MRHASRSTKRKRIRPEEMPSSASREVVSLIRDGGRVTKKRIIEGTDFDPRISIFSPDEEKALPILGSPLDPSEFSEKQGTSKEGASKEPSLDNPSRSVSVSLPPFATSPPIELPQAKIQAWIPYRMEFLHELLRLEAPPKYSPRQESPPRDSRCIECESSSDHHCLSCFSGGLTCKGCLVSHHANTPLHRVQVNLLVSITSSRTDTY